MKRTLILGTLFCLSMTMLTGCRVSPMQDPAPISHSMQTSQIRTAIIRGMGARGWNVKSESDGLIVAQNNVRGKHMVVVDIAYDSDSIDISYSSSENLHYHKTSSGREMIHNNYNTWVENLRQDISREITLLKAAP